MTNEMILPVGTTPVHPLRLALSLPPERFQNVILLVTDLTADYGCRIEEVLCSKGYQVEVVHSDSLADSLKDKAGASDFSIIMGPARKQEAMHIWKSVVRDAKRIPYIWVHHKVTTSKGKTIDAEYIKALPNEYLGVEKEVFPLPEIGAELACQIYDYDSSKLQADDELQWDSRKCMFVLTVGPPSGAHTIQTKKGVQDWEKLVLNKAEAIRKSFGKHAVEAWHTPLPSKGWWLTARQRLADAGFRGAANK